MYVVYDIAERFTTNRVGYDEIAGKEVRLFVRLFVVRFLFVCLCVCNLFVCLNRLPDGFLESS